MVGYKYNTEQEAIDAVALCNEYYGIPVSEDSVTQTFTDYFYNESIGYYIIYSEELQQVLGNPQEIIIILNKL